MNSRIITTLLLTLGCIFAVVRAKPSTHELVTHEIHVAWTSARTIYVYAPSDAPNLPLVVAMHGMNSSPLAHRDQTAWDELAARENFIVVFPQVLNLPINPFIEHAYANAVLDFMEATYHVDPQRIYATGFSLGGGYAEVIGLTLGERVAAFADVSGTLPNDSLLPQTIARPIPALLIHGRDDDVVAYADKQRAVQRWVAWNDCADLPEVSQGPHGVTTAVYADCADAGHVEFVSFESGHTFPRGDAPFDAPDRMWRFLSQYQLPDDQPPNAP